MDDEYSIEEYEEWVMKDFPVNNDWEPELFYIACERDLIHKAVTEGQVGEAEIEKLQKIDAIWQNQLMHPSLPSLSLKWERIGTEKTHWWFWYDEFTELSDLQKSTL
jgi:hypothetical protein